MKGKEEEDMKDGGKERLRLMRGGKERTDRTEREGRVWIRKE